MAHQDALDGNGRRAPLGLRFVAAGAGAEPFRMKMSEWIAAEGGPGRLLPWLPIAFGAGIAGYFALEREPPLAPGAVAALLLLLLAFVLRRRSRLFVIAALAAALTAGFA